MVAVALQEWLTGADEGLRRAFADWVRRLTERLAPDGAELPPMRTLEEVRMTLEERVAEWPKQWFREGVEQGLERGAGGGGRVARALRHRRGLAGARDGAGGRRERARRRGYRLTGSKPGWTLFHHAMHRSQSPCG